MPIEREPCPQCGGPVHFSEIDGPAYLRLREDEPSMFWRCTKCGHAWNNKPGYVSPIQRLFGRSKPQV